MDDSPPLPPPVLRLDLLRPWDTPTPPGPDQHDHPAPATPTPRSTNPFGAAAATATAPLLDPYPFNAHYTHLTHAGVLHELFLDSSSPPGASPRVIWRSAGQMRADLAPSPPLLAISACLCHLPLWTPHPVAIVVQSDRLVRCTDLVTGHVRWTSLVLTDTKAVVRAVPLEDNGVVFLCPGALVSVLVDHPSAEQSVVAVQQAPGAALVPYAIPRGHGIVMPGAEGGAVGQLWITFGEGEVHMYRVLRLPALKVQPDILDTTTRDVDEDSVMVADASVLSEDGPATLMPLGVSSSTPAAAARRVSEPASKPKTRKSASRKSSRRSTPKEQADGPAPAAPASSKKSKPMQDPETQAKEHRQLHDTQRANATVLHAQPANPPRHVPEHDATATRVVLVPLFTSPLHLPIARVIECQAVTGHVCLAVAFTDGSVSIHEVDAPQAPMHQVARWDHTLGAVGVRVWGARAVAVMPHPGEMHVWLGYAQGVVRVDMSRAPTAGQLALGLNDRVVFRLAGPATYAQAALASVRWDRSPEMRAVLQVVAAVVPLDVYLAVRDAPRASDPLATVLLDVVGAHSRAMLCTVAVGLFLLVQEWSLNALMHKSARHLAMALVPLLKALGWVQHLEYLVHRYFATRVEQVLGTVGEQVGTDAQEPAPLCLVAFAHAQGSGLVWPTLRDLARQFGVSETVQPAQPDHELYPMTCALAHLLECLHTAPMDSCDLLSHLTPTLAHLHDLWQHARPSFQSLPIGWRMLVICTIELARLEPELVGALPFSATTFLDRDDLAFGPAPPCHANQHITDTMFTNNEHTLHDAHDLAMARQLLTLPDTLHVAYNYRYLQGPDHKKEQEQQAVLDTALDRLLAVYAGAGALDFKCMAYDRGFVPANPIPLPLTVEMHFEARSTKDMSANTWALILPPLDTQVQPDTHVFDWVLFHAGVAKALAMQLPGELMGPTPPPPATDPPAATTQEGVSRSDPLVEWLWAHRPALTTRPWPMPLGGWWLGLGLLGHLGHLPAEFLTYLLVPARALPGTPPVFQPGMDVGVLLGVASSRVGTRDSALFRVLLLYAPDVFGVSGQPAATSTTLGQRPQQPQVQGKHQGQLHSLQTQMAAVLATGLIMAGSGHAEVSVNLLDNAVCVPHAMSPDKNGLGDVAAGEGMRVVGAIALAFVQLGRAEHRWLGLLAPLWDPRNTLATVTAAPAWIILGWVFFNSIDDSVSKAAAIGHVGSSQVREMVPHILFFRVVAGMLVEWDKVCVEYVRRVRTRVRAQAKEMAGTSVSDLALMAADTVVSAALYVLALKYAGTADRVAAQMCWDLVDELVARLHVDPDIVRHLDSDYKLGFAPAAVQQLSNLSNQWIYTAHVSAALILSGSGDRTAYRRLVRLHHRTGPTISYGLHSQANLALGLLFCGRGRHAVRATTPTSALALFASTLPCFTPVSYDDNTTTLHAMTHLWVLAAKASVVHAVSVHSGQPVTVCATLSRPTDDAAMCETSSDITLPHKFELPLPDPGAWTLSIDDPAWYPLTLLVDDLVGGHAGVRPVHLLPKNGLELAGHANASRVIQHTLPAKVEHLLAQLRRLIDAKPPSIQALEAVRLLGAHPIALKLFSALERRYRGRGTSGPSRIAVEVERLRQDLARDMPLPVFSAKHVLAFGLGNKTGSQFVTSPVDLQEMASRAVFYGTLISTKQVYKERAVHAAQEFGLVADAFLLELLCEEDASVVFPADVCSSDAPDS